VRNSRKREGRGKGKKKDNDGLDLQKEGKRMQGGKTKRAKGYVERGGVQKRSGPKREKRRKRKTRKGPGFGGGGPSNQGNRGRPENCKKGLLTICGV